MQPDDPRDPSGRGTLEACGRRSPPGRRPSARPRRRRARASSRGRPPRPPRRASASAAGRLADRGLDLRVDRVAAEIDVQRKPQPPCRSAVERPREVERRCERHDVALVRPLGAREEEPRVGDRARERPEVVDRVELRREEVERDAAEARLQADDARPGGRDPHRAAHVGPLGERARSRTRPPRPSRPRIRRACARGSTDCA